MSDRGWVVGMVWDEPDTRELAFRLMPKPWHFPIDSPEIALNARSRSLHPLRYRARDVLRVWRRYRASSLRRGRDAHDRVQSSWQGGRGGDRDRSASALSPIPHCLYRTAVGQSGSFIESPPSPGGRCSSAALAPQAPNSTSWPASGRRARVRRRRHRRATTCVCARARLLCR